MMARAPVADGPRRCARADAGATPQRPRLSLRCDHSGAGKASHWLISVCMDPSDSNPGTALLIIDMQRDFCDPRGYAAQAGMDVQLLRTPIAPILALRAQARRLGWRVIYTREGHRPDGSDCHPEKMRRSLAAGAAIGSAGPMGRLLIRGAHGHDLIDELVPLPGEPVVDKPGYGAFYQTDLELLLRSAGIQSLVLTGVTTDVCVHSTLREAVDRGFACTTVSDACAAGDLQLHAAALRMIHGEGNIFGRVVDTATLLQEMPAS
jgi:nicotinamidase-related amidase